MWPRVATTSNSAQAQGKKQQLRTDELLEVRTQSPEDADLEQHLEFLMDHFPLHKLAQGLEQGDWEVVSDIAVLYDTCTCGASLSRKWMSLFGPFVSRVQISTYPTEFDETNFGTPEPEFDGLNPPTR